jgi:hypothetical protein
MDGVCLYSRLQDQVFLHNQLRMRCGTKQGKAEVNCAFVCNRSERTGGSALAGITHHMFVLYASDI